MINLGVRLTDLHFWEVLRTRRWLHVLLAAGVLMLCVLLPFGISPSRLRLLTVMLYGVGGLLILLRWPQLGIIGIIVIAVLVPSPDLPGGLNLSILLLGVLFGLWLLTLIVQKHKVVFIDLPPIRALLLFCLVVLLAFGNGQLPWFSAHAHAPMDAQIGGVAIFILAAGAFLLVAHLMHNWRWLQWLTWSFLIVGGIFIAGWFIPLLSLVTSRLVPFAIPSNSMFWVWLMALAFSQALFNRDLFVGWRLALGGLFLTTFYVAFFRSYDWKGGWMPSIVAIAAIIAIRSPRVGAIMALTGTLPALYLYSQAVATDEYSYSTRLDAWKLMLEMIKVNPLLGFGPANYYWYTPLFPIRGYEVQFNSHSQYIDIVAQTGILGLACFFWFAWEISRLGWHLRERAPEGFPRAYVYGVLGGWVGTLSAGILVDWFLPFVYNIGLSGFRASVLPWLFLGGLVSIERICRRQT